MGDVCPSKNVTRHGNVLYLHRFDTPTGNRVVLEGLGALPARATLLNDGRPVEFSRVSLPSRCRRDVKDPVRLTNLPVDELAGTVMVIKLELG